MLVLEITETVMMADYDIASGASGELKELGHPHRDGRLRNGLLVARLPQPAPVDILKMDRSFLAANASPEASGLAAAIIALGRTLGVQVLAEGIESSDAVRGASRASAATTARGSSSHVRWSSPRRANGSPQRLHARRGGRVATR